MTLTGPNQRRTLFFLMVALIILVGDYFMFLLTEQIPPWVIWGVVGDFLLIVPLLYYFMILKKRKNSSIFSVISIMFLGVLLLYLTIPNTYHTYLVYLAVPLGIIELSATCFAIYKLIQIYRNIKNTKEENLHLSDAIRLGITKSMGNSIAIRLMVNELLIGLYTFFSWKMKNPLREAYPSFTYHKKEYFSIFIMILHSAILESVGVHFLLHNWSPIAAWIHTFLGIYGLFFLIGDFRAMQHHPFILKDQELILQVGLRKKIIMDLNNISKLQNGNQEKYVAERKAKRKDIFIASVGLFEVPQYEIILKEPVLATGLFGRQQWVSKVYLSVDEPQKLVPYLHGL